MAFQLYKSIHIDFLLYIMTMETLNASRITCFRSPFLGRLKGDVTNITEKLYNTQLPNFKSRFKSRSFTSSTRIFIRDNQILRTGIRTIISIQSC